MYQTAWIPAPVFNRLLLLAACWLLGLSLCAPPAAAQPINDDCANALPVQLGADNLGVGVFHSDTINLTGATRAPGEYFHPTQLTAGTDKQTMWFRFTLPTARFVSLELAQENPATGISSDAAGMTVFKSSSCAALNEDSVVAAKLTSIDKLGASFNPCLEPGEYLVQVSGRNDADGKLFLEFIVDTSGVLDNHNYPSNALDLGLLSNQTLDLVFEPGCYSIDNASGYDSCSALGGLTQSLFVTFQTGASPDYIGLRVVDDATGLNIQQAGAFKLYEGNVRVVSPDAAPLVQGCTPLDLPANPTDFEANTFFCQLAPNTPYSVQLMLPGELVDDTLRLELFSYGNTEGRAMDPQNLPPAYRIDPLPATFAGITTTLQDSFGCNSRMANHLYPPHQPDTVAFNGQQYELASWSTFRLTEKTSIDIQTSGWFTQDFYKRLYRGDITQDSSLTLVMEGLDAATGWFPLTCLDTGVYSLQVLGRLDRSTTDDNPQNFFHYGRPVTIDIRAQVYRENTYGLRQANDYFPLNGGAPLALGQQLAAPTGYFDCDRTPLPAGVAALSCGGQAVTDTNSAHYYTFVLDTSGSIVINHSNPNVLANLYEGDAQGLAQAQGLIGVAGGRIQGLTTNRSCLPMRYTACLDAGVYTLVVLAGREELGDSNQVRIEFLEHDFDLMQPNNFQPINGGAPLLTDSAYFTQLDFLPCYSTPKPTDYTDCDGAPTTDTLSMLYRTFTLSDSSLVQFYQGGSDPSTPHRLYRGNLTTLAQAQGAIANPQEITGAQDLIGCQLFNGISPGDDNFFRQCLTPGEYTLVAVGGLDDVGQTSAPILQVSIPNTLFWDPANPDTSIPILYVAADSSDTTYESISDTFSCISNPDTIDSMPPCTGTDKLIYREFYMPEEGHIRIEEAGERGTYALYSGQVSVVGIPGLELYEDSAYGEWYCFQNRETEDCYPLPEGWYTLVAYGRGGSYANPRYITNNGGDIKNSTKADITRLFKRKPQYNRPYKAFEANNGNPVDYRTPPGGGLYPRTWNVYPFAEEYFNCQQDTPFSSHPLNGCTSANRTYNRTAYYVFTLARESFVKIIGNTPGALPSNIAMQLYPFDVRVDSQLMASTTPILNCQNRADEAGGPYDFNGPSISRLQPGTYTLVCLASDDNLFSTIFPALYVEQVRGSRFDFASTAYDFGEMPGDNVLIAGRAGDTNPENPLWAPTVDFFGLQTGASVNDPGQRDASLLPGVNTVCGVGGYPRGGPTSVPYPLPVDYVHHPMGPDCTSAPLVRRNLWYTFVTDGAGRILLNVSNPDTHNYRTQPAYAVTLYESDERGNLDFASLLAGGNLDSTLAQGLTPVASSAPGGGCSHQVELQHIMPNCNIGERRRFFAVVDLLADRNSHHNYPNTPVQVQVNFDEEPYIPYVYDFISSANHINGLNQQQPPYTPVTLGPGTYLGDTMAFTCHSTSPGDPPEGGGCADQTMWYTFSAREPGTLFLNFDDVTNNQTFLTGDAEVKVYREVSPGDTTSQGLQHIPQLGVTNVDTPWARYCMPAGRYYIMFTGCGFDYERIVPRIKLEANLGDICAAPSPVTVPGPGLQLANLDITCHSMGEDYGEDSLLPALGCLLPSTASVYNDSTNRWNYKTSWYEVVLTSPDKLDVTFELLENTNVAPRDIRFRIMLGDCDAMSPSLCTTDANTGTELTCMPSQGRYFIQVLSPVNAQGDISLRVDARISTDQTCQPVNTFDPVANFINTGACQSDTFQFINYSSRGDSVLYRWDFGDGATDTVLNPTHVFPDSLYTVDYPVRLEVISLIGAQLRDTVDIPTRVFPVPRISGPDSICDRDTVTYQASTPGAWGVVSPFGSTIDPSGLYTAGYSGSSDTFFVDTLIYTADTGGCVREFPVVVKPRPFPAPPDQVDSICSGYPGVLNLDNPDPNLIYIWYTDSVFGSRIDTTYALQVDTLFNDTVFYVAKTDRGCDSYQRGSYAVSVLQTPAVPDSLVYYACENDTGLAWVQNPEPGVQYNWYTDSADATPVLANSDTFRTDTTLQGDTTLWLEAQRDICPSLGRAPVRFYYSDTSVTFTSTGDFCEGDTFTLNVVPSGGFLPHAFQWLGSPDSVSQVSRVAIRDSVYQVRVTDSVGCTHVGGVFVQVNPNPRISLGSDTVLCGVDSTYRFNPSYNGVNPPYTFLYQPADNLDDPQLVQPTWRRSGSVVDTITARMTDNLGCQALDSLIIYRSQTITFDPDTSPIFCPFDTANVWVQALGGLPPFSFTWYPQSSYYYQQDGRDTSIVGVVPLADFPLNLEVVDSVGCRATSFKNVVVRPGPYADAGGNATLCHDSPAFDLDGSAGGGTPPYTYQWFSSSTLQNANQRQAQLTDLNPRVHTVTLEIQDVHGCAARDTAYVTRAEALVASAGADRTICSAEPVTLAAGVTGGTRPYRYQWEPRSFLLTPANRDTVLAAPESPTQFRLQVVDSIGCQAIDSMQVRFAPSLELFPQNDTICQGDSVTLVVQASGVAPFAYQWAPVGGLSDPNSPMPRAAPLSDALYTVEVRDSNNCRGSAQVSVRVSQGLSLGVQDTFLCALQPVELSVPAVGGTPPYNFIWFNRSQGPTYTLQPDSMATVVPVTVVDAAGCTTSNQLSVQFETDFPQADFQLAPADTGIRPFTVDFLNSSQRAARYAWTFGRPDWTSTQANPSFTFTEPDTYQVQLVAYNDRNCADTASAEIRVREPNPLLELPNVFSPNVDGVGDRFPYVYQDLVEFEMWVYDRWGVEVFYTNSLTNLWTGMCGDEPCPDGVYFYLARAVGVEGERFERVGNVTIVR